MNHNTAFPKGVSGYRKGCRCDECKQAERERWQRSRDRRRNGPVPEHVHGTWNGYSNYGCKCLDCLEACRAQYEKAAEYRAANRDKISERRRKYYLEVKAREEAEDKARRTG